MFFLRVFSLNLFFLYLVITSYSIHYTKLYDGNGAGEHGLAGPGWSDEQDTVRDAGTDGGELLGVLEELDDLGEFLLA